MKTSRILLLTVLFCLCITPALAWSDNLNNNESTYYYTGTAFTFSDVKITPFGSSPYPDTNCIAKVASGAPIEFLITPNGSTYSNYFAATLSQNNNKASGFGLFDIDRVIFGQTYGYGTVAANGYLHRYEVVRSGTTLYIYKDGTLEDTYTSVPGTLAYSYGVGPTGPQTDYIDDISFGNAFSDTGLVSAPPHSDYVLSDMINPSNFGLYTSAGTLLSSSQIHIQWAVGPENDGWQVAGSPPNTRYSIRITAPDGSVINSTYLNFTATGAAAGIYSYPINATYIAGAPLQYGMYWVTLYDGSSVKSSDYFYVLGTGASISWDKPAYVVGSTPVVSYSISSAYYDTATYNYEIEILDAYGSVKKTQTVTGQTGSISFTLDSSTYSDGVYYAEIIAVPKSGSSNIVMNYAVTEVNSYITISGYVMNENAAALSGAIVNISESGSYQISTTDASGHYSSSNNWLSGSEINVTTTASGYTPDINKFTPLAADSIILNRTLISLTPTYSGVAIGGIVQDTQYHSTVPGATVYLRVNGTSATPSSITANSAAYYIFNGLTNGTTYDIWSQKTGYANSTMVQKMAVGV